MNTATTTLSQSVETTAHTPHCECQGTGLIEKRGLRGHAFHICENPFCVAGKESRVAALEAANRT